MRLALFGLLAACAHAPVRPSTAAQSADIISRSHAVLDAVDRGDVPSVRAAAAPSFVHFEGSAPETLDELVQHIAKRGPADHVGERTWDKERVLVHDNDALFIGRATEVQAGNTVHGGYRYVGCVGFTKDPNRLLVETVRGRQPGAALDVAMGQGRNALYLAG